MDKRGIYEVHVTQTLFCRVLIVAGSAQEAEDIARRGVEEDRVWKFDKAKILFAAQNGEGEYKGGYTANEAATLFYDVEENVLTVQPSVVYADGDNCLQVLNPRAAAVCSDLQLMLDASGKKFVRRRKRQEKQIVLGNLSDMITGAFQITQPQHMKP